MRVQRVLVLFAVMAMLVAIAPHGGGLAFTAHGAGKYTPSRGLSAQETVEAYFEQQYNSYVHNSYTDLSSIIDDGQKSIRNMTRWWRILLQRRELIQENNLCYVETRQFKYSIKYDDAPDDDRMRLWRDFLNETGCTVVHFKIEGERGKAYPPIMAPNAQHSMFLEKTDGVWKIVMHYFPGSARKFPATGSISIPSKSAMLAQLKEEFASGVFSAPKIPEGATVYDAENAVRYARKYTEKKNPQFYVIGDWIGDCQNFVSQCVWAGLGGGGRMDGIWSGGKSGGTAAWAHVNSFWNYITNTSGGLVGRQLESAGQLKNGDVVETRQLTSISEKGRFTHTFIVADENKLVLAQNTPAAYVYYSDLANVEARYVRPLYTSN